MSADNKGDRGYRLVCGPSATALVMGSIDAAVRPHMQDVRAMLRLPLPEVGITAGCNFATLHVLLNVISGLSRLMGPSPPNSGKAFKKFVARWYPWRLEPASSSFRQKRGTDVIYERFRNGFVHDLGLSLESGTVDKRNVRRDRLRIDGPATGVIKQASLSPEALVELDNVNVRPSWLGPTVARDGRRGLLVDVVAVYWGVRRLIFDHTSTPAGVRSLHRMVEQTIERERAAGMLDTIDVSASGEVRINGRRASIRQLDALERRRRKAASGRSGSSV